MEFNTLAFSKEIIIRACKVSLVVGTLLAVINYADKILLQQMLTLDWIKLGITYLVPYVVTTYSSVKAIQSTMVKPR